MFFFFVGMPIDAEFLITGEEANLPSLLEVSSFLYDLNLSYEISRLAADADYVDFRFSHFALYRKGRPLAEEARLRVKRLSQNSPVSIETLMWGAPLVVGAIWGVVQTIEKISNWRLNRRILEEQLRKLQHENEAADRRAVGQARENRVIISTEEEFLATIRERQAGPLLDQIANRLRGSTVRIKEMDIRFVRRSTRVEEK